MSYTWGRLSALVLGVALAAQGQSFQRDALEIWIGGDKGYNGLAEVGLRFEQDTGIPVFVKTPADWADDMDVPERFDKFANTTEGPDIVIWPHDRFGVWINAGLLSEVRPSGQAREKVADFAWEGVQHGSAYYGYPIATEAISLIYNRDLVHTPPTTYEEIIALDRQLRSQGRRALSMHWSETYFMWHLVTAGGGYSWANDDGNYLLNDVGFKQPGAVEGVQMLRRLMAEGVIEPEDDYGRMQQQFVDGEAAMVINGPWGWGDYRGVNFALAPLPGLNARYPGPGKPFVGILAAGLNAVSPNQADAIRFIEDYLLSAEGLRTINADRPLGAVVLNEMEGEVNRDPNLRVTLQQAELGEIMPGIPEIGRFWSLWAFELPRMVNGEVDVAQNLNQMAQRLERLDETKAWRRLHYPSE